MAANLAAYLESDRKADIDWADPAARTAHLKVLVQDAEAVLDLADEQDDDPEVRSAAWLLTKVLGDDVAANENGDPEIADGVAEDRIVSLSDPEMRHGRKSAAQRFDGRRIQVAANQKSKLLLAVEPTAANAGDGRDLMPVIEAVEEQYGVILERAIGDGAYGSGDNRAACSKRGVDLVSPETTPSDPEVHKMAFCIDLEAKQVTCPQGHVVSQSQDGQGCPGAACAPLHLRIEFLARPVEDEMAAVLVFLGG